MKKIKSGPTHFRRALKIKGQTEHSGRGFYMMDYDCTPEELSKRIDALVAKYPDRYDAEEDEDEGTKVVRIKSELMQPAPDFGFPELSGRTYYHTLVLTRGSLFVAM